MKKDNDLSSNVLSNEKARAIVAQLLETGKKDGFLTIDKINDIIGDAIDPEKIEDLVKVLSGAGIDIVKDKPESSTIPSKVSKKTNKISTVGKAETKSSNLSSGIVSKSSEQDKNTGSKFAVNDSDDNKDKDVNLSLEENYVRNTDDPVKIYLRSINKVGLLTREEEVATAMKIDEAKNRVIKGLFKIPFVLKYILDWYNGLSNGSIQLRDVIRIDETVNNDLYTEELLQDNSNNILSSDGGSDIKSITDTEDTSADLISSIFDTEEDKDDDFMLQNRQKTADDEFSEMLEQQNNDDIDEDDRDDLYANLCNVERSLLPKVLTVLEKASTIVQKILNNSRGKHWFDESCRKI